MLVIAANCQWLAKRIEEGWRSNPAYLSTSPLVASTE
jgi:hypothetical protein